MVPVVNPSNSVFKKLVASSSRTLFSVWMLLSTHWTLPAQDKSNAVSNQKAINKALTKMHFIYIYTKNRTVDFEDVTDPFSCIYSCSCGNCFQLVLNKLNYRVWSRTIIYVKCLETMHNLYCDLVLHKLNCLYLTWHGSLIATNLQRISTQLCRSPWLCRALWHLHTALTNLITRKLFPARKLWYSHCILTWPVLNCRQTQLYGAFSSKRTRYFNRSSRRSKNHWTFLWWPGTWLQIKNWAVCWSYS